jgi:threonine synthase
MFDLCGRDGRTVSQSMAGFRESGTMRMADDALEEVRTLFDARRLDDAGIAATIDKTWREAGILIDPHTATAAHAAVHKRRDPSVPMVVLGTAHPAKFVDAVQGACGLRPQLPDRLAGLMDLPEHVRSLPNDLALVQAFVRDRAAVTVGGDVAQ